MNIHNDDNKRNIIKIKYFYIFFKYLDFNI